MLLFALAQEAGAETARGGFLKMAGLTTTTTTTTMVTLFYRYVQVLSPGTTPGTFITDEGRTKDNLLNKQHHFGH